MLAAPAGAGSYDDTNSNWVYSGNWTPHKGSEPFSGNTIHYTGTVGDAASFAFEGIQFILTYTQNTNRANIDVYVDGNKVTTINANGPLVFQSTYTSAIYSSGVHVVELRNAGGGGGYIDVDAIQVIAAPAGAGTYDDASSNWVYSGNWTFYSGNLEFANNTMHYTGSVGDTASFTFAGTQFVFTYTQNTNRGDIDVYVDGNKVTTINANGPLVFQSTYTSPTYSSGTHVVQFRNAGGGGGYIDVDAIQILP